MNSFEQVKECSVNKISLFKEIANNTQKPLEVLREAISNSVDANAGNILIETFIDEETNLFVLKIKDDGDGMNLSELDDFFSLGSSKKKQRKRIGEKGLGSIIFFKSKKLEVITQKNDIRYHAILNHAWEKIQEGTTLDYKYKEVDAITAMDGTEILIYGFEINNFIKHHFNFYSMKDYILWFTAAGSFKTQFSNVNELRQLVNNIHSTPVITLIDRINNIQDEFVGEHPFEEPDENPKESGALQFDRMNFYSKRFGPYHRTEMINGKYVSFQIYGAISGVNKRNEIINFGPGQRHRSRFGLVFCKDFIPFNNMKEFLLDDNNYSHYHLLINSQNFELTADRNNITNMDSPEVQWIIDEAKILIREKITDVSMKTYFLMKDEEEMQKAAHERKIETALRLAALVDKEDIIIPKIGTMKKPENESQTLMVLSAILASHDIESLRIVDYSSKASTDLIIMDEKNIPILAEVEYKLSSALRHGHPIDTLDQIWCWRNDLELNHFYTLGEHNVIMIKSSDKHYIKHGADKLIRVFEISKILNELHLIE